MKYLSLLIASVFVLTLGGCASAPSSSSRSYETRPNQRGGDTKLARTKNTRAVELIDAGQLAAAQTLLQEALSADVMFGPAHNNLGKIYYEQSRFYLAAWEFEYAIKLMPNFPEPRNNLGMVFETVDQLDKAIGYYREALNMEPDNVELIGNLVRAQLRRGDRGDDVRQLLGDMILKDTRADWVAWAREKLALLPPDKADP